MLHPFIPRFTLTLSILAACGGGDNGSASATDASTSSTTTDAATSQPTSGGTTMAAALPPAAPTDLTASILDGGVHLVWKDAADNEDNFIIEHKIDGEADFTLVLELPFNSVTYHDTAVTAGTGYTYRVKAVNAGGESLSNEAMIKVP